MVSLGLSAPSAGRRGKVDADSSLAVLPGLVNPVRVDSLDVVWIKSAGRNIRSILCVAGLAMLEWNSSDTLPICSLRGV